MNPDQAAQRWRQARTARQRRDVELETFPTTAGSSAKTSHPMSPPMPPRPAAGRVAGRVVQPPAPFGLTDWGAWNPAAIEHVGGGYHLVAANVISDEPGWFVSGGRNHVRWNLCVWLIRPNGTISDPWTSDGYTQRGFLDCDGNQQYEYAAPPFGEMTDESTPKLTRWGEGALLTFSSNVVDRALFADFQTDLGWPQVTCSGSTPVWPDAPSQASVYRYLWHDGVNPQAGEPFELYRGPDGDFGTGDYEEFGNTFHDDGIINGFDVTGPSADDRIVTFGPTIQSGKYRAWLLQRDGDGAITLLQRTDLASDGDWYNGCGLTRVSYHRWVAMAGDNTGDGMIAVLFHSGTGTTIDTAQFDTGLVDGYYLPSFYVYYASNHLHYDGSQVVAGWARRIGSGLSATLQHRLTALQVDATSVTAGPIEQWATETRADRGGSSQWLYSGRWVETCEGCLRLIDSWTMRQQSLIERRQWKTGPAALPTGEPEGGGYSGTTGLSDQRVTPSSHPAGSMWSVNVPQESPYSWWYPVRLIRHPA